MFRRWLLHRSQTRSFQPRPGDPRYRQACATAARTASATLEASGRFARVGDTERRSSARRVASRGTCQIQLITDSPSCQRAVTLDCVVATSALLSAVHVLTLALGLGAVFARGRALAGLLDETGWRRLLVADNLWGIAAGLWIASGFGRVFFGGKEPTFYWRNGLFWVKLALFALVFALELTPMAAFIRVRSARRRQTALPRLSVERLRLINSMEIVLVVSIVFVAAFMARGAWLF